MTHSRLSALGLFLAVLLCFQTARAQQTNPPDNDPTAAEAALREKAFKQLDSLADQLSSLQSAENRARIGSNIADSIWPHDETRARALFALAEQDVSAGLQASINDRKPDLAVFLKLRQDIIERIVKHDAELAFTFLKRTELPPSAEWPSGFKQQQQALELRLGKQIAAENPEIALKLAQQTLAQGFSRDLLILLIRLDRKDKQQAATLYKDIVAKVRDMDLSRRWQDIQFTSDLVRVFSPPDDSAYRDLISILLAKANQYGCGQHREFAEEDGRLAYCREIGSFLPQIQKGLAPEPERVTGWMGNTFARAVPAQGVYELDDLTFGDGTIDEMVALIARYPALEGPIRLRAMDKAAATGDYEPAKAIGSAYGGADAEIREAIDIRLDNYNRRTSQAAEEISEERLAETQKSIARYPPAEQIGVWLRVASQAATHNPKVALRILNQVGAMADALPAGELQLGSQLAMAIVYCQAKSDRGFAIMESVLPKLNELIAAAVKLDGFDTHYLRDGEWNMSASGSTGGLLTGMAELAGYFSWYDFDRAINLAAQFERPEIRMMAQLKLAQGILAGTPKRLPVSGGAHID